MAQSYIMLDVNDERAEAVAEVIGNKTCKKIIQALSESELSEAELSKKLGSPANTVNYNVKKLVEAGLIEKSKQFWSVKGKKVPTYRISNKKIIISPKPMTKGILPAAILTGLATVGIKLFFNSGVSENQTTYVATDSALKMAAPTALRYAGESAGASAGASASGAIISSSAVGPWAWFLLGAWGALLIFVIYSTWRRE